MTLSFKKKCLLSNDIYDYHYVSQGKTSIPSIDDNEDLEFTHEAFNILHFSEEETFNIYKCVSAVMNMGKFAHLILQIFSYVHSETLKYTHFHIIKMGVFQCL